MTILVIFVIFAMSFTLRSTRFHSSSKRTEKRGVVLDKRFLLRKDVNILSSPSDCPVVCSRLYHHRNPAHSIFSGSHPSCISMAKGGVDHFFLLYHAEQRNSKHPTVLYSAVDLESFLQLLLLHWSRYR